MHKKLRLNYDKIATLLSVLVLLLTMTVAILFALSGTTNPTSAATDWYNSNWLYRQKITVDNTKVPNTDQTDFPVYIDLSDMSSGFFTNVKSDGSDIVVTASDGATKLDRELVSISTGSSTGELWFKAPTLSNSTDTDFWIYYGNSSASETNSTNVWSDNYVFVQHMNEDPSGTAPQVLDSTSNDNDGTSNGTMTTADLVSGKIGNSIDHDGTDDYINVSDDASLGSFSNFTVSLWMNLDTVARNERWLAKWGSGSDRTFIFGPTDYNDTIELVLGNITRYQVPISNLPTGEWAKATATWDGTNVRIYINGSLIGTSGTISPSIADGTTDMQVGNWSSDYVDGALDEIRIATEAKSADWLTTEYNNQNSPSTFYTASTQETFTLGWYNSSWAYRQKIMIDSSKVPNTDQADFPVYVDLSELSSFMFDAAKSDGSDLVITGPDGVTKLSREIVSFDNTSFTGELWFKAPALSSGFDSEFYIYYGNSGASETNDTAVWSNGIEMVQHMNEDPSGSSPQMQDSTTNSVDGTSSGSMTSGDLIPGIIGDSLDFDDSNDFIDFGTAAFNVDDGTMSIWVKVDGFSSAESNVIFSQDASGHTVNDFLLYINGASSNKFSVSTDNGGSVDTIVSDSAPTIGEWNHVAVSWGIGGMEMYVNGSLQIDTSSRTDGLSSTSASTELGARDRSSFYFNGDIDNWTVYNEVKSVDWIATEYNNQSDTSAFYAVNLPENENDSVGWYNSNWAYRAKVTIDNTKVGTGNQLDFPLYVDLADLDSNFFTNVKNDGSDILVTYLNGTTKLNRELVDVDTSGSTGELWVRVPMVHDTQDTDIYIYYGNVSATETNDTGTWNDNYALVQHMNEDPSGAAPQVTDSTSNSNDGTSAGSMTSGDVLAGQLGNAIDFDASNDYIDSGNDTSLDISDDTITLSTWIRPGADTARVIFGKPHTTTHSDPYFKYSLFYDGSTFARQIQFRIDNTYLRSGATTCAQDTWCHVVGKYDGVDMEIFINGSSVASTAKTGNVQVSTENLRTGINRGGGEAFGGRIDEVKISDDALSDGWIATEYNNQYSPSTFYTVTSEESFALGWYDTNWEYRQKIVIDSSQVPNANQTDFPVYIDLSELSSFMFDNAKSDGSDIVVTAANGTTKLSRELVNFDNTNFTGELWVKVPSLSYQYDTELYVYYGNSSAAETNDTDVWGTEYAMVQHMNEDPSGTAPQLQDSTSNSNDGTSGGGMATSDLVIGRLDDAIDFDGSDDYIDVGKFKLTEEVNISTWIKADDLDTTIDGIFDARRSSGSGNEIALFESGSNGVRFFGANSGGTGAWDISSSTLSTNTWYHIVGNSDGTTAKLYVNGVQAASASVSGTIDTDSNPSTGWYIGKQHYDVGNDRKFNGLIDEMRVSTSSKSADWIATEYNNQSDTSTFYEVSLPERNDGVAWYNTSWGFRQKVTIDNTKVSTSNQLEFPLYIDLSDMNSNFFTYVQSDGGDIVVTALDGKTKLDIEVVDINTSGSTGELWVRAPMLDDEVDTDFYIYYGNGSATETNSADVWIKDYVMVQHLDENPSGTAPQLVNSQNNSQNNGSTNGIMTTGDSVTGKLGTGIDFDGTDDSATIGSVTGIPTGNSVVTISGWMNSDNLTGLKGMLAWGTCGGQRTEMGIGRNSSVVRHMYCAWTGSPTDLDGSTTVSASTWYYVVATWDGDSGEIFLNGVSDGTSGTGSLNVQAANYYMGRRPQSGTFFDGILDELRISDSVRSDSWILTEYYNQNSPSTFYTIATEEGNTGCLAVDGGVNDDDSTVDGTITIQSNQTWTGTTIGQGVIDCSGLDFVVKNGYTFTFDNLEDGDVDYTEDYSVKLIADDFEIESGGILSADELGYPGGATGDGAGPGGGSHTTSNAQDGAGGSYGGKGGDGSQSTTLAKEIYGSVIEPTDLGSGGGRGGSSAKAGGAGGGAIKLQLTGDLTVNGDITANGESYPSTRGGAGSGGSVWLDIAGGISGSGDITAEGGEASNLAGAGGGGRISIEYATNTYTGTYSSIGGQVPASRQGEDGSLILVDHTNNYLTIQQDQRWIPDDATSFETWFSTVTDLFINNSSTLNLDSGNTETASSGFGWALDLSSLTVSTGSSISADGLGYSGSSDSSDGYGPGGGGTTTSSGEGGAGGSFGGKGADGSVGTAKAVYDEVANPDQPGSGGGRGGSSVQPGGDGGGAIKITTSGNLVQNGDITADGEAGLTTVGGGGSGGAIWLEVGGTHSGSGNISVNGGEGGSDSNSGAGGGGRIFIEYATSTHTGTLSAIGGQTPVGRKGENGTVVKHDTANDHLYIDHTQRWVPTTTTMFEDWFSTVTDVTISSSSTLGLDSAGKETASSGYGWVWDIDNLTINSGSKISGDGLGYKGSTSAADGYGPGGGGSNTASNEGGGGGSYGGLGADGSQGSATFVYDEVPNPDQPGSGGGRGGGSVQPGGDGGSSIKITTQSNLVLNGDITADGEAGLTTLGGGGAGGSVWLSVNGTLSGSGDVSANGGAGGSDNNAGAGGGGRILIEYAASTHSGTLSAIGGQTPTGRKGENGTVVKYDTTNTHIYTDHTQRWVPTTTTMFEDWFPSATDMTISSSSTLELDSTNKDQASGGYGWAIGLDNMTINSGSTLTGYGYYGSTTSAAGDGPGGGGSNTGSNQGGAGAGHGGAGADGVGTTAGSTYGSSTEPITPGSGGGLGGASLHAGTDGGGAVQLFIGDTLTVNGDIIETADDVISDSGGGGAGGSIYIKADTLTGSGNINAEGGDGGTTINAGGAGGGGRININYCTSTSWSGTTSVQAGQLPATRIGTDGTSSINSATLGYITNLGSGLNAYLSSDWSTDLENASNTQDCLTGVGIEDNDNSNRIAEFQVYFDGNLNFSVVDADSDSTKAYFDVTSTYSDIPGFYDLEPSYSLYVLKSTGSRVGICPGETTLGNINSSCTSLYYLDATDANVEVVDVSGTDYWKVSGLTTTTGAFTEISNTLPTATSVSIDSGASAATLTEGTTTTISCTGTVTDVDGFGNILSVEAILYRTGIGAGATDNNNNHYTLTGDTECVPSNGSGNTEDYTCDFAVEFHADATDVGSPNAADDWTCQMTPSDGAGAGTADTDTIEMNSLVAHSITSTIAYGYLEQTQDTGTSNQTVIVTNTGNRAIDNNISGADMCTDYPTCVGDVLGVSNQEYSTLTFTYGSGTNLSSTPTLVNLSIAKPTSSPSNSSSSIYWGIGIPGIQSSGVYSGTNIFTAVLD